MKATGRTVYREGKPRKAYKDTEHANKSRRSRAKYDGQLKASRVRGKYGPSMAPAPVTVRSLETGEVVVTVKAAPSPAEIKSKMTARGGWARESLASWGVPWPAPSGWRRRLEAQWHAENPDG